MRACVCVCNHQLLGHYLSTIIMLNIIKFKLSKYGALNIFEADNTLVCGRRFRYANYSSMPVILRKFFFQK